jgi:hypothetical protein
MPFQGKDSPALACEAAFDAKNRALDRIFLLLYLRRS